MIVKQRYLLEVSWRFKAMCVYQKGVFFLSWNAKFSGTARLAGEELREANVEFPLFAKTNVTHWAK